MVGCRGRSFSRGLAFICSGLVIIVLSHVGSLEAGTVVNLAWDTNTESDLAGYKVKYGTAPGTYSTVLPLPKSTTTYQVQSLTPGTTYYFVVTAYDNAGNESLPSNEVSAQPATTGPQPTVTSALEVLSGSIYIPQSGSQTINVSGTNFQTGAVVSLTSDIAVGPTSLAASTSLTAPITVSPSASLGGRALTVTNPDGGSGSKVDALVVVKTADTNRDCKVDLLDLNVLARAWNTSTADSAYNAAADLDGNGQIDGNDLTILIKYLGKPLAVCP
jgi:dockerin type I repeat protein/fibronectin type III domain protein